MTYPTPVVVKRLTAALALAQGLVIGSGISGRSLALYRFAAGVEGATLARELGISKQRLSDIERIETVDIDRAQRYLAAVDAIAREALP